MRAWPMMLLAAAIANGAFARGDTIFRCDDGRGGALYANAPCSGGRVIEVPEARPDPAARERLQRDLDAFERRQAARDAALLRARELENEARNRDLAERRRQEEAQALYAPPNAYYYSPFFVPHGQRPIKPRPRPSRTSSFVPVR